MGDDDNPTHYENRLTADVGPLLGLNADDIRLANLDIHAKNRFARIGAAEAKKAAQRARELFDVGALAQAVASELCSFSASSPSDSLPCRFLEWASENLTEKHAIFDEETMTHLDVDARFALALFEVCFVDKPNEEASTEIRRGQSISSLFLAGASESNLRADAEDVEVSEPVLSAAAGCETVAISILPASTKTQGMASILRAESSKAEWSNTARLYAFLEHLIFEDIMTTCKNLFFRLPFFDNSTDTARLFQ